MTQYKVATIETVRVTGYVYSKITLEAVEKLQVGGQVALYQKELVVLVADASTINPDDIYELRKVEQ